MLTVKVPRRTTMYANPIPFRSSGCTIMHVHDNPRPVWLEVGSKHSYELYLRRPVRGLHDSLELASYLK